MKNNVLMLLLLLCPVIGWAQTDTIRVKPELLQEPEAPETILLDERPVRNEMPAGPFVGLINGQKIPAYSIRYKTPLFKPRYFLLDDSMRIAADEVRMYQDESGYYERVSLVRRNLEFAKRSTTGRISKFYTVRTSYDPGYPGYGYGYPVGAGYGIGFTRQRFTYYFSKDGEPLQPLNYKNLKVALEDNAGSMASLQRYKQNKNIETGLFVAGAGLLIGGMTATVNSMQNNDGTGRVSPAIYAGLIVVNVPWVMRLFQRDRMQEAIDIYNRKKR